MAARIAVIGAGLAGLAAADELQRAGYAVELFERSRLLGGRATSFHLDGIEVDNGQHVFLGCCTELLDFIDRAGLSGSVHLQDRFDALLISRHGGASRLRAAGLPVPWHLVVSFARYRHLGWMAKARIARALAATGSAQRFTGTFAEWLARHGQTDETMRAFWEPFFVPALNAPLDCVSAADAGFVIATAFLSSPDAARFGYSTVPLARIAAAAAERIDSVHLGTPVLCLDVDQDAHRVQALVAGGGERMAFDGVVAALTPVQLTRLLGEPERFGVAGLDAYESHAIIDVHLWHDRGRLGVEFAALLDSPVQWVFEKGDGYLCCSLSAADELVGEPADTLVQRCWRDVASMVPGLASARLERGSVTRVRDATFVAKPGAARPGPATGLPNFTIAGAWTDTGWPDTMESAVRSGRAAARQLAGVLGGSHGA